MTFKRNLMVDTRLVRQARLYGKLHGGLTADAVAELALALLLAEDSRIAQADAKLEAAKTQAWRELEKEWRVMDETKAATDEL